MKTLLSLLSKLFGLVLVALIIFVSFLQLTKPAVPSFESIQNHFENNFRSGITRWVPVDQISTELMHMTILGTNGFTPERKAGWSDGIAGSLCIERGSNNGVGYSNLAWRVTRAMIQAHSPISIADYSKSLLNKFSFCTSVADLDRAYTFNQLLEVYFNLSRYHSDIIGISTASQVLFQKPPMQLNIVESAIVTALAAAPYASEATITQNACNLLHASSYVPSPEQECAKLTTLVVRGFERARVFSRPAPASPAEPPATAPANLL